MASRRTRIKGIANIPQRRKPGTVPNNIKEEEEEEHVNSVPEIDGDSNLNPTTTTPLLLDDQENKTIQDDKLDCPPPTSNNNAVIKLEEIPAAADAGIASELAPKSRRKFIKPSISVNAINRKPKESFVERTDRQLIGSDEEKSSESKGIVILNQFISFPNENNSIITPLKQHQNQNVLVDDHHQNNNVITESPSHVLVENDYPVPPPSPSKVNRSRIKAVPRLGQRNTSFSASESEDETRRNYQRIRNDSVCSSTASGYQDSNSISECPSPQKPKEFNILIQRKCRRTEQSRKLAEARRDFYIKFGNNKPDRQKLTMIDLIFYNPTTNLMSHETKATAKKDEILVGEENSRTSIAADREEQEEDEPSADEENNKNEKSDEENEMPAPQIKIGPQGEIIVDEQSLVIESKAVKKGREDLQKSNVVDGDFETSYGLYKRAKRSKDWNKQETIKFYKALNTIGTDFTLMCELFPRRTRRELKMKFKKEERINKALVDRAIMKPCGFDFNEFKEEVEMEELEQLEIEKQKEKEVQMRKEMVRKRKISSCSSKSETPPPSSNKSIKLIEPKGHPAKKKKALDIMNVLDDDDDDADGDESDLEQLDGDETQSRIITNMQKATRSGRIPKILERYNNTPKISNQQQQQQHDKLAETESEPGTLMVMASPGQNGDPVYNVFMVTGDQKQQIGTDISSLKKAVEFKENCNLKSLFTLSATPLTTAPEENNITIQEDAGTTY